MTSYFLSFLQVLQVHLRGGIFLPRYACEGVVAMGHWDVDLQLLRLLDGDGGLQAWCVCVCACCAVPHACTCPCVHLMCQRGHVAMCAGVLLCCCAVVLLCYCAGVQVCCCAYDMPECVHALRICSLVPSFPLFIMFAPLFL